MRMFPILLLTSCQKFGGLSGLSDALDGLKPTIAFKNLSVDSISFDAVSVDLTFDVDNPNPVAISMASLDYALALEGQRVLSGDQADGFSLPAGGSTELSVPLTLAFADVSDLLDATRGKDELDFALSGDMGFDTPAGAIKLPYNAAGTMPVLRTPKVSLSALRLEDLAILENKASLALDLEVSNRGASNIALSALDYDLSLAGSKAANGTARTLGEVAGDSTGTLTLPIDLSLTGLASSLIQTFQNRGDVEVGLNATASIDTPFGAIPLDISKSRSLKVQQ